MVSPDYEEPGSHKKWILLETAGGQVSTTCYHYNQLTCFPHKNCLYIDLCVSIQGDLQTDPKYSSFRDVTPIDFGLQNLYSNFCIRSHSL